ncbi:MAG: hypothetical protein CV087_06205, partial [Candidatus Brocadia sp. WS118]
SNDLATLSASTFLGGDSDDSGKGIAVDTSNNVFVTGVTIDATTDLPTTGGAYDTTHNGTWDVFVSKFSNDLTTLLASTFLGGSSYDEGYGIAVDTSKNVFVTGYTHDYTTDLPTTFGAYDTTHNGGYDVFVSKFNSDLSYLPTVVTLISFEGEATEGGIVTLAWQTATETDNAGFNIYRSRLRDGEYKKINDTLIPAKGDATSGASYRYDDTPPAKGTYFYKMEDVDTNGVSTMHGPEKVRVKK